MQYRNIVSIPNIDDNTVWTQIGDFYWPDPASVTKWNGTEFAKDPEASVADLPDHMHYYTTYVEQQPQYFEEVV